MQLTNTFSVPVPADTVWTTLLDVERVAPCMPGATVDRVDGDDILGSVKVKLGPIMMRYQGRLTFTEKDEANHRAVMTAQAREARGSGSVNATISATLTPAGDGTDVSVVTDLDITGKAAQFGRGVMIDVSRRIMSQFADNLAKEIDSSRLGTAADTPLRAATPGPAAAPTLSGSEPGSTAQTPPVTGSSSRADDSLDALNLMKEPARRLLPLAAALLVGIVLGRLTKRSRQY